MESQSPGLLFFLIFKFIENVALLQLNTSGGVSCSLEMRLQIAFFVKNKGNSLKRRWIKLKQPRSDSL